MINIPIDPEVSRVLKVLQDQSDSALCEGRKSEQEYRDLNCCKNKDRAKVQAQTTRGGQNSNRGSSNQPFCLALETLIVTEKHSYDFRRGSR